MVWMAIAPFAYGQIEPMIYNYARFDQCQAAGITLYKVYEAKNDDSLKLERIIIFTEKLNTVFCQHSNYIDF